MGKGSTLGWGGPEGERVKGERGHKKWGNWKAAGRRGRRGGGRAVEQNENVNTEKRRTRIAPK